MLKKSYTSMLGLSLLFFASGASAGDKFALKCTFDETRDSSFTTVFDLNAKTALDVDDGQIDNLKISEEHLIIVNVDGNTVINRVTGEMKDVNTNSRGSCEKVALKKF